MPARRVLLYVQHLLGIGHLKRAAALADGMVRAGLEVTLVTGGMPVLGLELNATHCVQLAPASAADLSFKTLVDEQGRPVDDAWKAMRRKQLMDAWSACEPDALVIELFPFGRRQMRFELLPLLEAARARSPRPWIISSVRDVLGGGQTDPARADQMLATFDRYFDHVLVHGDGALAPFECSFRHAGRLEGRMHYTGYVVGPAQPAGIGDATETATAGAQGGVLVSVGGGAVGQRLLEVAVQARPLSSLHAEPWRLLAGVNAAEADLAHLRALAQAQPGITIERFRSDFTHLLARCRVSVSQGGYNTVMEVLQARAAAVIVPFAGGSETEQSLRARLLADTGRIALVEEAGLSPQALALAIDRAAQWDAVGASPVHLDGARTAAALLCGWLERPAP
jgi:predicted glycosyltransferase